MKSSGRVVSAPSKIHMGHFLNSSHKEIFEQVAQYHCKKLLSKLQLLSPHKIAGKV
jgi:hypothetical protein